MALLSGTVSYPKFKDKGEGKAEFRCSLSTMKAFKEENKSRIFTNCVTYQAGLAKVLNEHFGKEEDEKKPVVFYGHFDEYEFTPNKQENPDHAKYYQKLKLTRKFLEGGGMKFADGGKEELTIEIPVTQTMRQFVITGFEFVDERNVTRTSSSGSKAENGGLLIASDDAESNPDGLVLSGSGGESKGKDDTVPF